MEWTQTFEHHCIYIYIYIYVVQSAGMHVSAFYASSVQLGTHQHMWLHCIYTRALALISRTRYNTTQPTHADMRRAS